MRKLTICATMGLLSLGAAVAPAQQIAVKAGVTVAPDSVRIGDPFRITVGIRAPRGATIEFPKATDSASTVQSLDPVAVRTSADTTAVEQYADYRVAAWDVGVQAIRLSDAVVRYNGAQRAIPLAARSSSRACSRPTARSVFRSRLGRCTSSAFFRGGLLRLSPRLSPRCSSSGGGGADVGSPSRSS